MVTTVRNAFKLLLGAIAALLYPAALPGAERVRPPVSDEAETRTLSSFIARIRVDPTLRALFAHNPRGTLREFGIDPTPFDLSDQLTDAQIQRLIADWTAGIPPGAEPERRALSPGYGPPSAPAVIYGPPAAPNPEPPGKP